jgi:hypothetical protein
MPGHLVLLARGIVRCVRREGDMAKKKVARSVAAFTLVLGVGTLIAPAAQAAPECRGVSSGVVQCWDDRVRECISNLRLPPAPC